MDSRTIPVPRRSIGSAFHDYVRGVFADRSVRRRTVRTKRARWLHGFAPRPTSSAEQRWEGEGGSL
jgi:hypothetical protein